MTQRTMTNAMVIARRRKTATACAEDNASGGGKGWGIMALSPVSTAPHTCGPFKSTCAAWNQRDLVDTLQLARGSFADRPWLCALPVGAHNEHVTCVLAESLKKSKSVIWTKY